MQFPVVMLVIGNGWRGGLVIATIGRPEMVHLFLDTHLAFCYCSTSPSDPLYSALILQSHKVDSM